MPELNRTFSPDRVVLAAVVTFGAIEEFKLLRFSFELFHGRGHRWFLRCDSQSEAVLRLIPNTSCVAAIPDSSSGKSAPEDSRFDGIVAQKMEAMADAWREPGVEMVVFLDADLLITAPLLPVLAQLEGEVLLTPHYFAAQRQQWEESRYGRYNSGFVAARTPRFHEWWTAAYRSQPEKFTDQQCLDDAGSVFRLGLLPPEANVGSWRGVRGTEGLPEFEIPKDCIFLHVHFFQPGGAPESLIRKCFAVEYFQFANLLKGVQQRPGTVFSPREIVQKAFAIQCLGFLRQGHRKGHGVLFEEITRLDRLGLYARALSEPETPAASLLPESTGAAVAPQVPAKQPAHSLPPGDYVSPGLCVVRPDAHFPHMAVADKSCVKWEHFRRDVPHNYWSDSRYPDCGFLNRDEAQILYNSALQFHGRRGLEIGCWMGWSACHIALAGLKLDVVDPLLENQLFQQSVLQSLRSAGVLNQVTLYVGKSPALVEELGLKRKQRWSFIFIDGSHNAPDPLNDARAAAEFAEPDALVLFHDLASPEVAQGLNFMRDAGWSTMIYQTTQIMGVAWRGKVQPVRHIPDPAVSWTVPAHLAGYAISGQDSGKPFAPAVPVGSPYKIGGLTLELPAEHMLPVFQKEHPLYDRFLPFLAPLAPGDSWIVDVGANVGDTVAAMIQHTEASILAIEGHETYFAYLTRNVGSMPASLRDRVRCVQAIAGSGAIAGTLYLEKGTARMIEGSSNSAPGVVPVEQILSGNSIDPQKVFLLKTDTDGFDADVLSSASTVLKEAAPILYFENQIDNPAQASRFEALYRLLEDSGYRHYWIFDNFGNLLLEDISERALGSLNRYLLVEQQKRSTRTFYYCDVLAAKPSGHAPVSRAINSYKRYMLPAASKDSSGNSLEELLPQTL